jgi:hypothetical protein
MRLSVAGGPTGLITIEPTTTAPAHALDGDATLAGCFARLARGGQSPADPSAAIDSRKRLAERLVEARRNVGQTVRLAADTARLAAELDRLFAVLAGASDPAALAAPLLPAKRRVAGDFRV